MQTKTLQTIENSNRFIFQRDVTDFLNEGFRLISANCNSEWNNASDDWNYSYQAILYREI